MKKKIIIAVIIILICLLMGGAGYYIYYNLPINRIDRAFKVQDYETVVELYGELTRDEDIDYVKSTLRDTARDYYDDYLEGDISYDDIDEYYGLVMKRVLKKDKALVVLRDNIEIIEDSRGNLVSGKELYDEGEYLEAIEVFGRIDKLAKKEYKEAQKYLDKCKDKYIESIVETADDLVVDEDYEGAIAVVIEAMDYFPDEQTLSDKLSEISALMEVDIAAKYTVTYDLGDMIAAELGLSDYEVYFPATLVFEIGEDSLKIYVDEASIESGLDALTSDEQSMNAVYTLAEDYGIGKKEADFLIMMTYGGSYTSFIMDNFGGEISEAMDEFTHQVSCHMDKKKIYIGAKDKSDDYLSYTEGDGYITLDSYSGKDGILSSLSYPLTLNKTR